MPWADPEISPWAQQQRSNMVRFCSYVATTAAETKCAVTRLMLNFAAWNLPSVHLHVQAAEDLVLCAMVRSAITAALGLPLDAVPGSHPTAPRPSPPTFNSNPLQPAGAPSQQPHPMAAAQAARPPSCMTTATAFGAGGGINIAPRPAGQQASSVSSLTALIGQPLPPASQPPAHPTSTPASSPATAAVAPVLAHSTSTPAVATVPTAAVATMAAFSSATGQAPTGNVSVGVSRPMPAVPQATMPQMPPGASAVATTGSQLTNAAATAAHHSATAPGVPSMSAAALSQPPTSTAGVRLPAVAAPQLSSTSAGLGGEPPQPGIVPLPVTVSAARGPTPGSRNILLTPTMLPPQPSTAVSTSVGQQQQVSGTAAAPQAARAFAPAAWAGSAGVGPGQGAGGTRTAAVGEDVWQLASDVMAAGGTATTAAAVTTAAQQVQLATMTQSALA